MTACLDEADALPPATADRTAWLRRLREHVPTLVVLLAAAWLLAIGCVKTVRPALASDSFLARDYAFASLQLLTFRFHAGVACFLIAGAFVLLKKHRFAVGLALAGCVGVWPEAVHAWPRVGDSASLGTPVRVMSLNNRKYSGNVSQIVAAIEANRPDLVAFQEFTHAMDGRLADAIGEDYPYRLSFPDQPSVGMALYSRWPMTLVIAPQSGPAFARVMSADVAIGGQSARVYVVHPASPHSAARVARNRQSIAALIETLDADRVPTLVVGDCNFPFDSQQTDALRFAGLAHVDDRAGWGLRWTWSPAELWPITRIDHAFVSRQWGVVGSRVLPDAGSDHRPIVVDLRLR